MCFFFERRTATDMRIRDWSSDVCSSDLIGPQQGAVTDLSHARIAIRVAGPKAAWVLAKGLALDLDSAAFPPLRVAQSAIHEVGVVVRRLSADKVGGDSFDLYVYRGFALRSEEHTSELQSLMRISYAVFCLQK